MAESKVNYEETPVRVRIIKEKKKNGGHEPSSWRELVREERFWAAAAQALGPIMIAILVFGDGIGWLGAILITAGIYVYWNGRSAFVKHHARQALIMQLAGTFGWILMILTGTAVWVVLLLVSILLILVLVGILLTPLVALMYPVFIIASFALPLSTAFLGGRGALEAWRGNRYDYPYLADWLNERFGPVSGGALVNDIQYV